MPYVGSSIFTSEHAYASVKMAPELAGGSLSLVSVAIAKLALDDATRRITAQIRNQDSFQALAKALKLRS
jgi:hypothetical protein